MLYQLLSLLCSSSNLSSLMIHFGPYLQALVGDKRKPKYSKTSVTKRYLGISWLQPSSLSSPSKCVSGPSITQMCSPPRFILASALSTLARQLKNTHKKGLSFLLKALPRARGEAYDCKMMEIICYLTFTNDGWPVCEDHQLKAFTLMHHLQLQ